MNRILYLACLSLSALTATAIAATPKLEVAFDKAGIASLKWAEAELLAAKSSPAISVRDADGAPIKIIPAAGGAVYANGTLTRTCDGLVVTTDMRQEKDVLHLTVTYRNTGKRAIGRIEDRPLVVQFPSRPKGKMWKWGYDVTTDTEDAPGVIVADWGDSKLLVCVEPGSTAPGAADAARPMTIGFLGNFGGNAVNAVLFRTVFQPALEPGKQWTFRAALRFASGETPAAEVAKDIYAKFAEAYPFTLNWPDRRPVGTIFLARTATKWPTNPRGWFNDEKVDITTESGKNAFHDRMMKLAETSIREMKGVGAQGMIFWDVEGQEMPHAISYLGDPRIVPQAAPEMDAVADEFFKKFLDAGLRTGVCIRPSKIISNGTGGWKHTQVADHVAEMADKIAYAKKRWGCTIIYMDTNVKWPMKDDPSGGMWQGNATVLPSGDLRALCRRHPDVLIFPEFGRFGYWSVCAPYAELRGGKVRTNDDIRQVYPQAGSVIAISDGDYLGRWDDLLPGVAAGDMHLFCGWFGDRYNPFVQRMYQEADFLRRAPKVQETGTLESLLGDADPRVRFVAVSRVAKPDAAQTAVLLNALDAEREWVVQRRIVDALGVAGNAAAVPALAGLLTDQKRGLDRAAAVALGRIGPPATKTLLACAAGKDQRVADAALLALGQYDDPAATSVLLSLADEGKASTRAAAVRALDRRPAPNVTAKLVALLDDRDPAVLLAACAALGQSKDHAAVKPLVNLIVRSVQELKNNTIREAAGDALEAITGLQYGPYETRWKKALDDGKL
jgi:hypothetical protein